MLWRRGPMYDSIILMAVKFVGEIGPFRWILFQSKWYGSFYFICLNLIKYIIALLRIIHGEEVFRF